MMTAGDQGSRQSDHRLVCKVREAHPEAIDAFLARLTCLPALVRGRAKEIGHQLTPNEVEEIVQNTFLVLWRKLDTYDGSSKLETWTYGIVVFEVFKARSIWVRATRNSELDEEMLPPQQDSTVAADEEAIEAALDRLGPPGDEIVRLKHFEGLTFEEISKRLAMPAKTVMSNYYRVLDRLRVLLRSEQPEDR